VRINQESLKEQSIIESRTILNLSLVKQVRSRSSVLCTPSFETVMDGYYRVYLVDDSFVGEFVD